MEILFRLARGNAENHLKVRLYLFILSQKCKALSFQKCEKNLNFFVLWTKLRK